MKNSKSLGLKLEIFNFKINCLENDKPVSFDVEDIPENFSVYFSNLTENLVKKLPNPSDKYGMLSKARYYRNLGITRKFDLLPAEEDCILKILRDNNISKAAGIDRLPGWCRLLPMSGADVLA